MLFIATLYECSWLSPRLRPRRPPSGRKRARAARTVSRTGRASNSSDRSCPTASTISKPSTPISSMCCGRRSCRRSTTSSAATGTPTSAFVPRASACARRSRPKPATSKASSIGISLARVPTAGVPHSASCVHTPSSENLAPGSSTVRSWTSTSSPTRSSTGTDRHRLLPQHPIPLHAGAGRVARHARHRASRCER